MKEGMAQEGRVIPVSEEESTDNSITDSGI